MRERKRTTGVLAAGILALHGAGAAQALEMGVFGDMSLGHSSAPGMLEEPSFRLGSLDLYALQYIDDHTKALFETQFQTFSGGEITVEIQRFWIMREVNDHFHIGMGRFHTPLGYWNRHFHHGILMQDTVSRPFFLAFEGGSSNSILPMHLIGILTEGEITGGLRYEAVISNSNTIDSASRSRLTVPNRADLGSRKTFFGRVSYDDYQRPFKPGFSVMRNDVLEAAASGGLAPRGEALVRQTLYGLDLRYEQGRFGLLSELYYIENETPTVDGRKRDSLAWFAQFGYRLTGRLLATYRYETLDFDDDDAYYMNPALVGRGSIGTEQRNVFALRYDFSESNALMLETSLRDPEIGDSSTTTILSWAFVMF